MTRTYRAVAAAVIAIGAFSSTASATGLGSWNHLGNGGSAGVPSLNAQVSALSTDEPGVLLVGGSFTNAGGLAKADRIASWNGAAWSALGNTPLGNGSVFAIAYHAGKVYAGGNFVNAGGDAAADYLAVYDGVSWEPFCNSTADPAFNAGGLQVTALQAIGTTLYVGGTFQNANGVASADYLIACNMDNGAMTSTVDGGGDFTGAIYDLAATTDGTLYAAGGFTNLDGDTAIDYVGAYDGSWHSLGSGAITTFVRSLTARGTDLFVGSDMLNIAGIAKADHVARWNGSTWAALGSNAADTNGWFPSSSTIYALATSASLVFATGSFQNANGQPTADNVAWFDGSTWHALGSNGAGDGPWSGEGHALALFQGLVHAGGNFTSAGGDSQAAFVASRSLKLPDAEIGTSSGNFVGTNRYNTTAAGQTKTISIARGGSSYFPVLVQNDGLVAASFSLRATGTATGYTVTFIRYEDGADITTGVRNGTFLTGNLAPGQSFAMKMIVKLSASAASSGSFVVKASSAAGTPPDAVKGIVHAT